LCGCESCGFRFAVHLGVLAFAALSAAPAPAEAAPTAPAERLLVLDFTATLGADPQLAKLVQDIFLARVHTIGRYEVMSQADVVQMLDIEQQRQLAGCDQGACFADVGGALGARWVASGGLSLLGGRSVLTLKLVDTQAARIENQIAKELPVAEGELAESIRVAAYELLRLPVPPPEDQPWYKKWWVWGAAGAVVGGVALTYVLMRPEPVPDAALGTVVLDAN
jgi:hypothetical protein